MTTSIPETNGTSETIETIETSTLWYEGSFANCPVDEISDNTKDVLDNMNEEK